MGSPERTALSRNGWINAFVFAPLVLPLIILGSDRAVVMNPDGYGAVIDPIAVFAVVGFASTAFVALRLTAGPGVDVWLLPAIVAPVAGLFGYVLVIRGVPTVSLMVKAQPTTVATRERPPTLAPGQNGERRDDFTETWFEQALVVLTRCAIRIRAHCSFRSSRVRLILKTTSQCARAWPSTRQNRLACARPKTRYWTSATARHSGICCCPSDR